MIHNCHQLVINSGCSNIYREGNCCADKLATHGHSSPRVSWFNTLLQLLLEDFFFEEAKMSYITTSKDSPSTRCTRVETTMSEQYLQAQNSKNRNNN